MAKEKKKKKKRRKNEKKSGNEVTSLLNLKILRSQDEVKNGVPLEVT